MFSLNFIYTGIIKKSVSDEKIDSKKENIKRGRHAGFCKKSKTSSILLAPPYIQCQMTVTNS